MKKYILILLAGIMLIGCGSTTNNNNEANETSESEPAKTIAKSVDNDKELYQKMAGAYAWDYEIDNEYDTFTLYSIENGYIVLDEEGKVEIWNDKPISDYFEYKIYDDLSELVVISKLGGEYHYSYERTEDGYLILGGPDDKKMYLKYFDTREDAQAYVDEIQSPVDNENLDHYEGYMTSEYVFDRINKDELNEYAYKTLDEVIMNYLKENESMGGYEFDKLSADNIIHSGGTYFTALECAFMTKYAGHNGVRYYAVLPSDINLEGKIYGTMYTIGFADAEIEFDENDKCNIKFETYVVTKDYDKFCQDNGIAFEWGSISDLANLRYRMTEVPKYEIVQLDGNAGKVDGNKSLSDYAEEIMEEKLSYAYESYMTRMGYTAEEETEGFTN